MIPLFPAEEFLKLKKTLLIYGWGQKILLTKLDILRQDFNNFHKSNPIENITSRMKAPESIAQKLVDQKFELTYDNARAHIKDIAGVRIICTYAKDIFFLAEMLRSMPHTTIASEKDYVGTPKPSGYRGFHIIMEIPVFYSERIESVPVEIQLRTAAMDFWATLEHKVKYKYKEHIPANLSDELVSCADQIAMLDDRMFTIQDTISKLNSDSDYAGDGFV